MRIRLRVLGIVGGVHGLLWAGGIFSHVAHGEPPADAAWVVPMLILDLAAGRWLAGRAE